MPHIDVDTMLICVPALEGPFNRGMEHMRRFACLRTSCVIRAVGLGTEVGRQQLTRLGSIPRVTSWWWA